MEELFLIKVREQARIEILETGMVSIETQIDLHEAIMGGKDVSAEYVSVAGF